jgi:hypothetical protein
VKIYYLIFSFSFLCHFVTAQDELATQSVLSMKGDTVIWNLVVPWSLHPELSHLFPQPTESIATRGDLITLSSKYILSRTSIYQNDDPISPIDWKMRDGVNRETSRVRAKYLVTPNRNIIIENRILTDINENQRNYHRWIVDENTEETFVTRLNKETYILTPDVYSNRQSSQFYAFLFALCALALVVVLWRKYRTAT